MKSIRLTMVLLLVWAGPALASGSVAALVEDVTGASAGVEFMDYVETGKIIRLNPQDSIVLSYLVSCVRETITGGVVTVGREQSEVQSGKVERISTACDAGRMTLTAELARQSAATVVRSLVPRRDQPRLPSSPQFTLYGLSPMVELGRGGGTVEITRVDQGVRALHGDHNALYDFAAAVRRCRLVASIEPQSVGKALHSKSIHPPNQGKTPIVGRLPRFDRAF